MSLDRTNSPDADAEHNIDDHREDHFDLGEPTFRLVVENAADGILLVDREGRPVYANNAAARIFGQRKRDLARLTLGQFVGTEDMTQITVIRPNRTPAEVELRAVEMTWNGQPVYLASLRDITARRAREDQLRQLQKLEAVGRLAAGITHDFRNLIAAVQSGLRLIGNKLSNEAPKTEIEGLIGEVMARTQTAEALTSQLLSFSRGHAMALQVVDINQRIDSVASMLRHTLGSGIEILTDLAEDAGVVETDADQFDMALLNLALNSRDAMDGHGVLTLESSLCAEADGLDGHAQFVQVTVRDTGSGMTADVKEKVFEPFFTTKGDGNGTGLGLIQVYGFAMRSGGHVRIDSEPGLGTAVHIFLPGRDEATSR